jgi:hypothetical protein
MPNFVELQGQQNVWRVLLGRLSIFLDNGYRSARRGRVGVAGDLRLLQISLLDEYRVARRDFRAAAHTTANRFRVGSGRGALRHGDIEKIMGNSIGCVGQLP